MYLFLERREGKEKEGGRNISLLCRIHVPIRDQSHNPGTCPDWESNRQPFALLDDAQPTEPPQSGQHCVLLNSYNSFTTLCCFRAFNIHGICLTWLCVLLTEENHLFPREYFQSRVLTQIYFLWLELKKSFRGASHMALSHT